MTQWDPDRYLTFAAERSRPFTELIGRVRGDPATIADLGCGPGHLTRVLRERWPRARIVGVDSSPDMIARAEDGNTDPEVSYHLADVTSWHGTADLIVSNALLQWVPQPLAVVGRLTALADEIAIAVPNNFNAPSHTLMRDIAARAPYADHLVGFEFRLGTPVEAYLEVFASRGWSVDAWETTYQHVLPGADAVFDWVSGTGARPVLQALPPELAAAFAADYRAALRTAYPRHRWGTVLPFTRAFVVARRPALV